MGFLGGILVCEVAIQEPFFYTKVYALEMSRLLLVGAYPNVNHIASAQAHYTDRFLNECDHIKVIFNLKLFERYRLSSIWYLKVLLHLHSFTYDFHLRSLNAFVSGRQFLLKSGFHLVSFLDDFSKYYNKVHLLKLSSSFHNNTHCKLVVGNPLGSKLRQKSSSLPQPGVKRPCYSR